MTEPTSLKTPEAGFVSGFGQENLQDGPLGSLPLPLPKTLGEFRAPDRDNDPNELIENRFLCRGGICLLVGPTCIGKSSLLMQLAIYLAAGKSLFGITPGKVYQKKGMRILLIRAENYEVDLAEMRDGVLAGSSIAEGELNHAVSRIEVCALNNQSRDGFAATLGKLLEHHGPFDLVMIDSSFACFGGDGDSEKDVRHFMRVLLTPLLKKHNVGLVLEHHLNKPRQRKRKDNWDAGGHAYLGAGAAQWINPARAALALLSRGSDSVFELRAIKRGTRLGWRDENGIPTVVQHISHSREPGTICWRQAETSEIEELTGQTCNHGS